MHGSTPSPALATMAAPGAFDRSAPLRRLVAAATVLLCAVSVAGFGGDLHWALDLTSHFRPQYALLLAPAALACFVLGARASGILAAGCLAVQIGTLLPFWLPAAPIPALGAAPLRVVLANVHTHNRDFAAVRAWVVREDADLVVLQETDRAWLDALADLGRQWPYRVEEPRDDNFGIAVWSRHPLHDARIVRFGQAGLPSVVAELDRDGDRLALVATHALPPVGAARTALRDQALAEVARFASACSGPVLVVGDLNCTPWSPQFRRLLARGRLHDSAEGLGLQATWPSWLSVFGIPLDHCLLGAGLRAVARRIGPPIGSDHRPLVIEVAFVTAR